MRSTDPKLAEIVAGALMGSAFERPAKWPLGIVVVRAERQYVTSRADFASWLAANDLEAPARECRSRRIPPGCVLCWLEVDVPEVAASGFLVLDMVAALRASAKPSSKKEEAPE